MDNWNAVVAMELGLTPWDLSKMFIDRIDRFGLIWWVDQIELQNSEIESTK